MLNSHKWNEKNKQGLNLGKTGVGQGGGII